MAIKKPRTRARTEKMPIHIRRCCTMGQRAMTVFSDVRLGEEEGPLLTRTCYSSHIESVLGEAAYKFCRYLYAKANGKRAEAAYSWEEATGAIEYELPMALLHPVKDLKGRKSREHAVEKVMLIIRAEMSQHRKMVERLYAKPGRTSDKKSNKWSVFNLKKPLVRPAESSFEEFFQWAEKMVMLTFDAEELLR